jgi:RNA polymerase sigma factor (sigma-70 family)
VTGLAPARGSPEGARFASARLDAETRRTLNAMMVRLADGDRTAFDGAYALLWPALLGFCKRTLAPADAEDAAQLALLKVFDRASTFQRDKDALTWAITIAAWEVRTTRKRHLRARSTSIEPDDQVSPTADPERAALEHELVEAARDVLGALPDDDRATLSATFDEEKPDGVSAAAFRKRRERAMSRLKEAWRRIHGH